MTWTALTLAGVAAMLAAFWCVVNKNMMFIACGIFSIVILGVRDTLKYKNRQKTRTAQLADRATELGFEFQETAPYNVLGWSRTFQLTKRGFAFEPVENESSLLGRIAALAVPRARNVFQRGWEEAQLAVFDYQFSDNDVTYNQAAAAIQSPRLDQPYFALLPATGWQRVSEKFRAEPALYGRHQLVTSADISPEAITNLVNQLAADATLEVGEGYLLLYRQNRRPLDADMLEQKIAEALQIYAAICIA